MGKAQLPQWLYADFTLEKKCPGYQRLLATAYRLSLARSVSEGFLEKYFVV
jgi:hypothetical protein